MTDKNLAAYFALVSGDLLNASGDVTFERVVQRAVEVVPGAEHATINLRRKGGRADTVAATSDKVRGLDAAQFDLGEGPCLDATFDHHNCVIEDLAADERWPQFASRAVEEGIRSVLAIRLNSAEQTLGALNLYAGPPDVFVGDSHDIALIFAAHATEALSKTRLVTNLQAALESRHLIGMAQGVLAVRYDVPYETAFTVLQRYSNDTNTKLRDVAQMVVETRTLPDKSVGRAAGREAAERASRGA